MPMRSLMILPLPNHHRSGLLYFFLVSRSMQTSQDIQILQLVLRAVLVLILASISTGHIKQLTSANFGSVGIYLFQVGSEIMFTYRSAETGTVPSGKIFTS